jgi:putative nucleotide binding protein
MKETIIVLDYLPNGHPMDPRPLHLREVLVQGIVMETFALLEVVPVKDFRPKVQDRLDVQNKERISRVKSRIHFRNLTHGAKIELEIAVKTIVEENEPKFVEFFNTATPITTRLHSLELIPGVGKKHMWDILNARKIKKFESFEDLKSKIRLLPDPKKGVVQRVINELQESDRYYLFIMPPKRVFQKRGRF